MKKEDLDGLKQAMDPLNRGGAVVLPLMAALALPTLLREREQLLGALRAVVADGYGLQALMDEEASDKEIAEYWSSELQRRQAYARAAIAAAES